MIRVIDENKSVDFYKKAFQLEVAQRFQFDGFTLVYLRNPENDFELELTINHGRTEPYSHGDAYGHLAVAVDDIAKEHARFEALGLNPKPVKEFNREGHCSRSSFSSKTPMAIKSRCCKNTVAIDNLAAPKWERNMPESKPAGGLSRRSFVQASSAALILTATAVIHPIEAWGLEAKGLTPATAQTLIQASRDIYPHDRLADRFYALAVKDFDAKIATDPQLKALFEEGVAQLDAAARTAHGVPYVGVGWEEERVALLKKIETTPFFKTLRAGLVTGLYNQKEIWPLFGYEGSSADKGGYIHRGFNDLTWL